MSGAIIKYLLVLLAHKISKKLDGEEKLGLLDGLSGQLLFLIRVEQSIPGTVDVSLLQQQFDRLQKNLSIHPFDISLSTGITGIGLMFELINDLFDCETDINSDIDQLLIKALRKTPWTGEYELLRGLTGFLLYALHRVEKTGNKELFDLVLAHLLARKHRVKGGITWLTGVDSLYLLNQGHQAETNLGLAHGNAGTLRVLTKAYHQCPSEDLKYIIQQHSDWFLEQGRSGYQGSYFGCFGGDTRQSRLAWCYGDLSNSLVLWHTGEALNNFKIKQYARKIALHSARRCLETSGVTDMGLCHGASGNAVIFNTLYQQMGEPTLQQASDYWLAHVFMAANSDKGLNALFRYDPLEGSYQESFGLLEGYAGIGLALLSLADYDKRWQSALLMD